jgi:drug/metabolite transporter (DMT)-like permease
MLFLAYLCAILKSVIYGTTIFFTTSLNENVEVFDILALRFLLSFIVMWLLKITGIIKIKIGVKDFLKKNEKSTFLKNIFMAALFEPVLYMLLETFGVSMTTNVTAAVIVSLSPVSSCIVEEIFLKEKSTLFQKFFLALGMFGAIFIAVNTSTTDGQNSLMGILFLIGAVVSGSLFTAFSRKSSSHFSPMDITYFSCMLGTVIFNAINITRHIVIGDIIHYFDPYFNIKNLIGFIVLGIMSTIVATMMNNFALSKLQISVMTAFGGVSTLVTIIVGIVFGGESLEFYHYIGLPFIIVRMIGVSAISIIRNKHNPT